MPAAAVADRLLGAYRPGRSVLHRLPAGAKLAGLLVSGIVLAVLGGWRSAVIALLAAVLLAAATVGLRTVLVSIRLLVLLALVLGAYLTWQQGWERAVSVVGDLVAMVVLATLLTVTTPVDRMLDAITTALRPARRFGVRPELVALAFSLLLRGIPTTVQLAEEAREAARARGLGRDPRAVLRPMVIRAVAHARLTGEALHARGIGTDERDDA